MFERIDEILREIESANGEIEILLGLAKISFVDYIAIKRCEADAPEGAAWNIPQIDAEVDRLKKAIDRLNKIKREVLVW